VNPNNNEAQSNYTIMWTLSGSPFSRQRLPVRVANPYPDRSVEVRLHAEQRLDWYRTYLEHTSVRLGPGEAREVEVMVECVADEPAFRDRVPRDRLYGEPNIVAAIAVVADPDANVTQPIGGATIEVRAARAAELIELDVSRSSVSGRGCGWFRTDLRRPPAERSWSPVVRTAGAGRSAFEPASARTARSP